MNGNNSLTLGLYSRLTAGFVRGHRASKAEPKARSLSPVTTPKNVVSIFSPLINILLSLKSIILHKYILIAFCKILHFEKLFFDFSLKKNINFQIQIQ